MDQVGEAEHELFHQEEQSVNSPSEKREADSGCGEQRKHNGTLKLWEEKMASESFIFVTGYDLSDCHFSIVIERNKPHPSESS